MKKSFSYNLTQFGSADNTVTEQIQTSDGVKTITTDASTGAVILADSVDADSLNPVTCAAVATAVEQAGGGVPEYDVEDAGKVLKVDAQGEDLVWGTAGGSYTEGDGIHIINDEISVALGSGGIQVDPSDNTLMIGDADYHMVYVDDGAIKVRHDSTISETVDNDNYGQLGVANPVPTPGAGDASKVLTVSDAQGNYGWATAQGGGGASTVHTSGPIYGDGSNDDPIRLSRDTGSLSLVTKLVATYQKDNKTVGGNYYPMGAGPLYYDEDSNNFKFTFDGQIVWPASEGVSAVSILFYNPSDNTEYALYDETWAGTLDSSYYTIGSNGVLTDKSISGTLSHWTYVGSGSLTLDKLKTFNCCLHLTGTTSSVMPSPAGTYCVPLAYLTAGRAGDALSVADAARVPSTSGITNGYVLTKNSAGFAWSAPPSGSLYTKTDDVYNGYIDLSGASAGWYLLQVVVNFTASISNPKSWEVEGMPVTGFGYTNNNYLPCHVSGSVHLNGDYSQMALTGVFQKTGSDFTVAGFNIHDASGNDLSTDISAMKTAYTYRIWKLS